MNPWQTPVLSQILILLVATAAATVQADPAPDISHLDHIAEPEGPVSDWSLELGGGILFSNVRDSDINSQTAVPLQLTAALAVDDVSLDDH